jgi:hypothetical protein
VADNENEQRLKLAAAQEQHMTNGHGDGKLNGQVVSHKKQQVKNGSAVCVLPPCLLKAMPARVCC